MKLTLLLTIAALALQVSAAPEPSTKREGTLTPIVEIVDSPNGPDLSLQPHRKRRSTETVTNITFAADAKNPIPTAWLSTSNIREPTG